VYVASGGGNVYEFTWTNSGWQGISMGNAGISDVKVQCVPAKARNDNLIRIYVAAGSGVYEYEWTGLAWQSARLGNAVAYMYGLAVGDGLNKGTTQIYASSYDGNVYVFDWQAVTTTVTVPDVVGQTEQAAATAITNASLTVGTITSTSSSTMPAGSVISQNPVAGTQIAPSSAVNLVVSSGPATVAVPYVVGQTQNAATNAIIATNLTVGTVSREFSATVPLGLVMSQDPGAGLEVPVGSAVNLVVSSGPLPSIQLTLSVDQLVLSWPTSATGFTLWFNTNVASTNWTVVSPLPTVVGENYISTNQFTEPAGFFRLQGE
jgi:hypothetical protein